MIHGQKNIKINKLFYINVKLDLHIKTGWGWWLWWWYEEAYLGL